MALKENDLIKVRNLTDHAVVYMSYDGRRRAFAGQQTMKISVEELRQLAYSRGGLVLLRNHLSIDNKELAEEFGIQSDTYDNEYQWTKEDVDRVLLSGDMDELLDALDFAPNGIIDLIISRAVNLRISDIAKRKAISEATGRNINSMIELVEDSEQEVEAPAEKPKTRRRAPKTEEKQTRRRSAKTEAEPQPEEPVESAE